MSAANYPDPSDRTRETRDQGPSVVNRLDSTIREGVAESRKFVEDQVSEHPTSAVLLSFAIGAGIGAMLGASLFDQYARRRLASDSLVGRLTESVSRAVSESLPAAMKRS